MEVIAQRQHSDQEQSVSVLRRALHWRFCYRLVVLLAVMASSAPAHAILSCQAGAGQTLGGAFDECAPLSNKFEATADSPHGDASVSAPTGSMSGTVTVSPTTISNGRFYGELIADFRINGPAPSGSVPVDFFFSTTGSIAGDCINCEANLGHSYQIDSVSFSGFQIRSSASRTRTSDWLITSSEFDNSGLGLNPTATASAVADIASGVLSFDAASAVGHTFRLTANLSGHANLTGPNSPDASLTVDAGHTALFNILLPAGYTLSAVPSHYSFLTAPILQPIPEASTYAMMLAGLGLVSLAAHRRKRAISN